MEALGVLLGLGGDAIECAEVGRGAAVVAMVSFGTGNGRRVEALREVLEVGV